MFAIGIEALAPGVHERTFKPEVEALELDPSVFRDVEVTARLDVAEGRILVSLTVRAHATLECDRTLRSFDQPIEGAYRILFSCAGFASDRKGSCNEVRIMDPSDRVLDLTDVTRDTLLLAVPARRVAPGAEDIDIPIRFGVPQGTQEQQHRPTLGGSQCIEVRGGPELSLAFTPIRLPVNTENYGESKKKTLQGSNTATPCPVLR